MSAHHSSVPKDCDGETLELNAPMMATAAGTLRTDAAFDLDLASGSSFFRGGASCDHTGTAHHDCNLRAMVLLVRLSQAQQVFQLSWKLTSLCF